ncbi:Inner membrane protein YrbG [uncultured bacterium]|nr:Inner membrane protein YrbG [uncultured bacterium]
MALLLAEFIIIAAIIVFCGTRLSKYGDIIAEKTGLGRAWTGLIIMASITSLPELMTGISSVTIADVPDIAAGNILGACVMNLLILALLDPMDKSSPIFHKVGQSHVLSAGYGILMLGLVSASIFLEGHIPALFHVGLYTPVIFVLYVIGIRLVYFYEKKYISTIAEETVEKLRYGHISGARAVFLYSANAAAIILAATWLPFIAEETARLTGLGTSFMGTFFVAMTTTLPEFVVSFAAIRIGAHDLAIGNLLGSNMFNIGILGIDDILYSKGPLLSDISKSHAVTALMAILMTAIVLISITYKHEKKAMRFGWDSMAMIAIGVISMYFVYIMG